ncbi:TPA: MFS transporter [Klebsiella pneumoniae]|nr:MFS transporter [Klebsiella pneumoniae]
MDSVHHIWCPLSSQEYQDLPDGAETTLTLIMVSLLALLALLATMFWLPGVRNSGSGNVREQLQALSHPAILTMMSITVLGFGGATLTGNLAGGHFSSTRGWSVTLGTQIVLLAVTLIALALFLQWKAAVIGGLFLWGTLAFGLSPAVQQGMLSVAERYCRICLSPEYICF